MTYTINPNAKNVWIRDNEDTMDLSPITDASSVYLENGRTIEQELGEGSMVSNVATVDNSMAKVIDGTLDGAYESGVLKGKSLVNCVEQSMFKPKYTSRVETEGGFVYTQTEYQVATRLQFDYTQYSLLNNNTYYLISFELKVNKARILNITTDGTGYEGYGLQIEENTHVLIRQKIKFSPNGTVLRIYVRCKDGIDYTNDTFTLKNLMLIPYQEGMENWDIPYFEGLCDVKMPILRNVGKNLIDGTGDYIGLAGTEGATSSNVLTGDGTLKRYSYIVRCKPNTTYTLTTAGTANRCSLGEYSNYPRIGMVGTKRGNTNTSGTLTITTKPTTTYLVCYSYYSETVHSQSEMDEIVRGLVVQLEESPSPTPYEDHKTNILHTPEEIVLRSLPNGVKDTYNVITGEYVKRIGEVVLDGSDELYYHSEERLETNRFRTRLNYITNKYTSDGLNFVCDKFISLSESQSIDNTTVGCWVENRGAVHLKLSKKDFPTNDASLFKQYLQQNPITVQYELATPIITTVDPIGVPFAYENGHVILESGYEGQSLLPTLEYSTVVNKTGQIQSVAKTIMKQEEQLSSLEKMLVQSIVEMDYNNTLLTLNLEINEVM